MGAVDAPESACMRARLVRRRIFDGFSFLSKVTSAKSERRKERGNQYGNENALVGKEGKKQDLSGQGLLPSAATAPPVNPDRRDVLRLLA